ncbi:MAG: tetratricopeptide repeat protein [Candidatus Binatia bacterium]
MRFPKTTALRNGTLAAMLGVAALLAACGNAETTGGNAETKGVDAGNTGDAAPAAPVADSKPAAPVPPTPATEAAPAAAPPSGSAAGFAATALSKRSTFPTELGTAATLRAGLPPSPAEAEAAAAPEPAAEVTDGPIAITYPQEGTLFPPEIVAPTFTWQGGGGDTKTWSITVRTEGDAELRFTADSRRWRPSEDDWKTIKQRSNERDAEVTVAREGGPGAAAVKIRTSKDPVGDSLFYREVPLPFLTAVQDPSRIRWRFGTIDSPEGPPIVLQNLPVCGNCHSFADNGSVLGLDVDYGNDKGAYAVIETAKNMVLNDEKIITWADFRKEDGELTFGLLSRVSPTGRYVVSTVKDRSVFVATPDIWFSQLFFPIKGILVVYDREKKTFTELPGADDPKYVQSNAVWSPDGKEIIFARAGVYKPEHLEQQNAALIDEKDVPEFTRDRKPFRYDLYRIPFNDGKGGKAVPVEGASGNGRSNYFAKYSPDGKWIVYTQSDSYMLLQPDSDLWIIPAAGGKARRLRYNTARMNSWHSWSSNSRWLVFSSKVNTAYTQLFLTHIDDEGNDSPPVLLERFTSPDRAANIPEFVRLPGDAITGIKEEFLDAYSFLRAGMANENTGDHKGAERSFRRGLELNPDSAELRNALGWTLFQDGRTGEAVAEYEKAVALDPKHVKSHNNLALALVELGSLEKAAKHYGQSAELEPKAEILSDLGFILARLERHKEAREHYEKALALDPRCASALFNLGVDSVRASEYARAEKYYREALAIKPNAQTWNGLGYSLARQRRNDEAVEAYRQAVQADPTFVPAGDNLADALARQGTYAEAEPLYRRALEREPTAARSNAVGTVLMKLGRLEEATRQFEESLKMDAANAEAVRKLKELQQP